MTLRLVIFAVAILGCRFAAAISPNASNPPVIDEQPIGRVATSGGHATFSLLAHGTAPVTYQWWSTTQPLANSARMTGVTAPVLNIDPLQVNDTSNYFAVVTSSGLSITSDVVSLVVSQFVVPPPVIINSTGILFSMFGQIADVYRVESSTNSGATYQTNGYTTNRTGRAQFMDQTVGSFRQFRFALDRVLPILYAPISQGTQAVLRAYGKLNQGWRFEATTNFVTWTNLATITNTTGWVKFTDTNAPRPATRFYRISPP